uniref:Uncharacterized protein n=1 Tax=Oryza punctata TaxID=4537 RepID=A0A0E0KFJ2_ORYPU
MASGSNDSDFMSVAPIAVRSSPRLNRAKSITSRGQHNVGKVTKKVASKRGSARNVQSNKQITSKGDTKKRRRIESETKPVVDFRCIPSPMSSVIASLSNDQNNFVCNAGFKSLLNMQACNVPKYMTLWLIDKVNYPRCTMEVGGKSIEIKPLVRKVIGALDRHIPVELSKEMDTRLNYKFSEDGRGLRVCEAISRMLKKDNEAEFTISFMMVTLAIFLAPGTTLSVNRDYLTTISNVIFMDFVANIYVPQGMSCIAHLTATHLDAVKSIDTSQHSRDPDYDSLQLKDIENTIYYEKTNIDADSQDAQPEGHDIAKSSVEGMLKMQDDQVRHNVNENDQCDQPQAFNELLTNIVEKLKFRRAEVMQQVKGSKMCDKYGSTGQGYIETNEGAEKGGTNSHFDDVVAIGATAAHDAYNIEHCTNDGPTGVAKGDERDGFDEHKDSGHNKYEDDGNADDGLRGGTDRIDEWSKKDEGDGGAGNGDEGSRNDTINGLYDGDEKGRIHSEDHGHQCGNCQSGSIDSKQDKEHPSTEEETIGTCTMDDTSCETQWTLQLILIEDSSQDSRPTDITVPPLTKPIEGGDS